MRVQPAPELSRQVVPEEVLAAKCDMMRRLRAEDMLRCEKNLAASLGLILQVRRPTLAQGTVFEQPFLFSPIHIRVSQFCSLARTLTALC